MKNDECRMSNDEGMTKLESRTVATTTRPVFGVRHLDLIRHSSFVHSSLAGLSKHGEIDEGDNSQTEEERVCLEIADLD